MLTKSSIAGRWVAGAAMALGFWLTAQAGMALASPGTEIVAQALPTPTPFRFLTPTPFAPSSTSPSTTTTTTTTTAPRAGGFPMELAFPMLAGGLAAIGGGALVFRRKTIR